MIGKDSEGGSRERSTQTPLIRLWCECEWYKSPPFPRQRLTQGLTSIKPVTLSQGIAPQVIMESWSMLQVTLMNDESDAHVP